MLMPSGDSQRLIAVATTQGFSHIKKNQPNQDAYAIDQGQNTIVSVCDGHGASSSFRSDLGSKIAAHSALECSKELMDQQQCFPHDLFSDIVQTWRGTVERHINELPFTLAEQKHLDVRFSEAERNWVAYGSTLLSIIETSDHYHFFQIGDGDILLLLDDDSILRPIDHDPRHLGNATTSICAMDAEADFHWRSFSKNEINPKLIMLSTDGYFNSYRSEEGFCQVARDIWAFYLEKGVSYLRDELEGWLAETSREGSGDDITAAFLIRSPSASSSVLPA
jgi:serine/threonine protein phosphatase PrpC